VWSRLAQLTVVAGWLACLLGLLAFVFFGGEWLSRFCEHLVSGGVLATSAWFKWQPSVCWDDGAEGRQAVQPLACHCSVLVAYRLPDGTALFVGLATSRVFTHVLCCVMTSSASRASDVTVMGLHCW
jgi:hypothetical protein